MSQVNSPQSRDSSSTIPAAEPQPAVPSSSPSNGPAPEDKSFEDGFQKIPQIAHDALDYLVNQHAGTRLTADGTLIRSWTEGQDASIMPTAAAIIAKLRLKDSSRFSETEAEDLAKLVRNLLDEQRPDGGWRNSMGDLKSRLSATVFGYLALYCVLDSLDSDLLQDLEPELVIQVRLACSMARKWILSAPVGLTRKAAIPPLMALSAFAQDILHEWDHFNFRDLFAPPALSDVKNFFRFLARAEFLPSRSSQMAKGELPIEIVFHSSLLAQQYYNLVFPEAYPKIHIPKAILKRLPSASKINESLLSTGMVPGAGHMLFGMLIGFLDEDTLQSAWAKDLADFISQYQDESGIWTYLPIASYLNVNAIQKVYPDSALAKESLQKLEGGQKDHLRQADSDTVMDAYAFNSATWNNVLILEAWFRADPASLGRPEFQEGLDYLLFCQFETGRFVFNHGAHESETENNFTGLIAGFLSLIRNEIMTHPESLPDNTERGTLLIRLNDAIGRAIQNLLDQQNDNGGWSAYVKNNKDKPAGAAPFAGITKLLGPEMQLSFSDPSTADSTANVLTLLGRNGHTAENSLNVRQALSWLEKDFVKGAGWWARWGSGYISGTHYVLEALSALGIDLKSDPRAQAMVEVYRNTQNADGGWGEDGMQSDNPAQDPKLALDFDSEPLETATVVLSLLLAGVDPQDDMLKKAVRYLVDHYQSATNETPASLQNMTLDEQEKLLWHNTRAFYDFTPTIWYTEELLVTDMYPIIALQRYAVARRSAAVDRGL